MSQDFLVEIGTEELPPKSLLTLSQAFQRELETHLRAVELTFGEVQAYATPRRLAVQITGLAGRTPDKREQIWGPPAKVAFDADGDPSRAGIAFAEKNGFPVEELRNKIANDGKQDKLCHERHIAGLATVELLADTVNAALDALPIAKRMRWGSRRDEFVRPVHWIVLLYGETVCPGTVMGLTPSNRSRGHRFHHPQEVVIATPDQYRSAMREAKVIAHFGERREVILEGVKQLAQAAEGHAVIDPNLLDEVTALNEWPVPLAGRFEKRFLEVPAEALISSMKEHQKYFHVVDDSGVLLPMFITVANIDSREPARVVAGNERVIRPRLSDAAFFYETDRKQTLESRREQLRNVVFQADLGTIFDKTERVAALAGTLAANCGGDPADAERAARLSKSDLVTNMVGEFDDLQGVMGRYYALDDGESAEVAEALFEQYLPRFSGDRLPATPTGRALALADRIDTLVGIFGIGQPPSGSRDPFALRRASLGVLRILVEGNIDLNLRPVLERAQALHSHLSVTDGLTEQVLTYLTERFRAWYEDENIPATVFMSIAAKRLDNPLDIHQRVHAVQAFNQLPEAAALAAANKRVSNILAKLDEPAADQVDSALLKEAAEQELATQLADYSARVAPLLVEHDYAQTLQVLAGLRDSVDRFFDDVMVMSDDQALRHNRLALLQQLRDLFLQVADISYLVPAR